MALAAFVVVVALLQVLAFQWRVGKGRNTFNAPGPTTTGPETWERYNRVHLNTVENLVVLLPLLWIIMRFCTRTSRRRWGCCS
jgi:glutathione S-transferase